MNYRTLTEGQLIDRSKILADKSKAGSATAADRNDWESILSEMDRRDAEWRSGVPREHRNGPGASDADVLAADGRGFSTNRSETPESRAFTDYLRNGTVGPELRAQGESSGDTGGFAVPESFLARLQIALKMYGGMSSAFQQIDTPDGRVTPFPTNNPTATQAQYLTENTSVSETDYTFGQGMMFAWTLTSGVILASLQLVQDSAVNVDAFVTARVGEAIGRKMAAEVVNGAGPGSKAGVGIIPSLTAFGATTDNSSGGVYSLGSATSVKMFSGDSTELESNVLAPATCFSMIAAIDPAYWPGAAFYMNANQALNIRQVVDDNGRPLLNLENGLQDGCVGSIGGFPVKVVQEIPDLTASTTGGPVFANLQHAMILRTVAGARVMRLVERYADFLQVGFIGYQRFDSQPNDLRAAAVVAAAST